MPTLKPPSMTKPMASQTDEDHSSPKIRGWRPLPDADRGRATAGIDRVGELRLPQRMALRLAVEQPQGDMPRSVSISVDCSFAEATIAALLRLALEGEGEQADQQGKARRRERDQREHTL